MSCGPRRYMPSYCCKVKLAIETEILAHERSLEITLRYHSREGRFSQAGKRFARSAEL